MTTAPSSPGRPVRLRRYRHADIINGFDARAGFTTLTAAELAAIQRYEDATPNLTDQVRFLAGMTAASYQLATRLGSHVQTMRLIAQHLEQINEWYQALALIANLNPDGGGQRPSHQAAMYWRREHAGIQAAGTAVRAAADDYVSSHQEAQ